MDEMKMRQIACEHWEEVFVAVNFEARQEGERTNRVLKKVGTSSKVLFGKKNAIETIFWLTDQPVESKKNWLLWLTVEKQYRRKLKRDRWNLHPCCIATELALQ